MKRNNLALALGGVLAACNVNALTIDSFDTLQANKRVINGDSVVTNNTSGAGVTYIGTSRDLSSQSTGTNSYTDASINFSFVSVLDMANNVNSTGVVYVQWYGISGPASDFTEAGNNFGLRISLPAPIDNSLTVTFLVNGTSSAVQTFPDGSVGELFPFAFASFSDPSVFTNVTELRMTMTGPTGWDAAVDLVETVPLPGTLMLMGIGLAGLARSVKRA